MRVVPDLRELVQRAVDRVLACVAVQIGLLSEASVAQRALEGLLLVVDVPDVPL